MIPKFRAWDKDERAILDVHGINFDAHGIWTNELIDDESDGNFIFLDDVELMRSTGLKDKNGVEIYEGDIIDKHYHNMHTYDDIAVVEFGKGYDSDGWAHGEWFGWVTNHDTSLADVYKKCTVLGNKFENPELLEDE